MGTERVEPEASSAWYRSMGRFLSGVDPLVADTLLALVLAVPLLVDLADVGVHPSPFRETDALGYALVALLVVPLALRRRFPVAVFCVILGAAIVTTLFAYRPASYGFGLIVATYTVARWCDRRTSLIALAAALGFSVFVKVRFILAGVDIGLFDWPLDVAYFAGSWFLGDSIRTRTRQAAELQRNREALAEQAVEREHLRIARELHDSIGHSLTIMVLYAGAAERVCETDPGRIRDLLETVATSGREAMAEMDRLVRVLRDESPSPADVSDVKALADEFRALGLPVEVTISGDAFALPSPVGHSAYRIAQEALTNTLKHAQANSARVQLQFASDALMVSVVDDGSGCPDVDLRTNGRHGLAGMRERVATLGGDLRVESGPAGAGFAVHARLPVTKERPQ